MTLDPGMHIVMHLVWFSKTRCDTDLAKRTGLWLFLEKRIVGIENVVEEEEYNQFDKIPSFDTYTSPNSWELTKHRTCEATIVKKIHIQKSRKKKQA
jgi:hypothetical protein